MPLCGFNPKMIRGLAEFTQGLYEQALKRSKDDGISVERAFEIEVAEMTVFLAEVDRRYYEELRPRHTVEEAMRQLVAWDVFESKGPNAS